jgi:4-amino-4-deoxy-L-arabinose transferase-like glycosyltransferase
MQLIPNEKLERFFRNGFVLLAVLTFLSSIIYVTASDIKEWDESRNGINAYEMLQRGSWLVPYYEGEVDTWNAKPPLFHWCIMLSYKLLGLSIFSMRLPSVLATMIFFLVFYRLMRRFTPPLTASLACMVLMSCKAVLGDHIGLTADFDSLLLLFLFLSVYAVVIYLQEGRRGPIIAAACFTGLAFWTKGAAGLILIPSIGFYLLWSKKQKVASPTIGSDLILALLVLVVFISTWILVSVNHISYDNPSMYGSNSQLETMWLHDVVKRLFLDDKGQFGTGHTWYFVFSALDTRMQLWSYVFFAVSIWLVFGVQKQLDAVQKNLLLISTLVIFPLGLLLTFSKNQHNWYLAPVYPFIAAVIAVGINKLIDHRMVFVLLMVVIPLQSIRQNHFLLTDRDEIPVSQGFAEIVKDKPVYYNQLPQHLILKMVFMGAQPMKWKEDTNEKKVNALWIESENEAIGQLGTIGKYNLLSK